MGMSRGWTQSICPEAQFYVGVEGKSPSEVPSRIGRNNYIILIRTRYRLWQNCLSAFLLQLSSSYLTQASCIMLADPTNPTVADLDDEPYDSAEDEDFQLDAAQDESELSDEDEAAEPAKKKRKTDKAEIPAEDLDSGDEAMVRNAREKRRKQKGKKGKARQAEEDEDIDFDDDEEGAPGGFVRTRAMKLRMYGHSVMSRCSVSVLI